MASQYQHRQFFRRVPDSLLARYFKTRDTDLGVDFVQLKETEVEPVFFALPVRTFQVFQLSGNEAYSPLCSTVTW